MERTSERLAVDLAADAEVRTEMGTEGFEDASRPGLGAEHDKILAEVVDLRDLARGELVGMRDREPPAWDR